jgi:ABC-type transporter Mla maintaining outer membrane lipid asymmetry permease subunit MlaE
MTVEVDAPTMLDKATEAVHDAREAVQMTSQSLAGAIDAGRRPGGLLDQLARLTREAPLQSLAIAFLLGFIVALRR